MSTQHRGTFRSHTKTIYSVSGALPGSSHSVRLSPIRRDINGFPVHIEGFVFQITALVNKTAASMSGACPGERVFDVLRNVTFGIGGGAHLFLRNLRGLDLWHDSRRIRGREYDTGYQDLADADATNASESRTLIVPFAHRDRSVAGAEDDGILPVAVLGDEDFSFNIGDANSVGFTGVSLVSVSVTVKAILRPHHKLLCPTAWQVRSESLTDSPILRGGSGYWQYLDLIDHDTAASRAITSVYGNIKLTIDAAEGEFRPAADFVLDEALEVSSKNPALLIPSPAAFTAVPIITNRRDMISRQPRGSVKIEMESRSTSRSTMISRTNGFVDSTYLEAFLARLGLSVEQLRRQAGAGARLEVQTARGGAPPHLRASLPVAIRYPGMPFSALREGEALRES